MIRMGGAQSGEVLGSMVGVVAGGGGRGCCGETREGDTGVEHSGPVDVWGTHLHREKAKRQWSVALFPGLPLKLLLI